jgi:hypothetical protein
MIINIVMVTSAIRGEDTRLLWGMLKATLGSLTESFGSLINTLSLMLIRLTACSLPTLLGSFLAAHPKAMFAQISEPVGRALR